MKKGITPRPHRPRVFFQAQMGQLLIYYCALLCEITARNFAVHKKGFCFYLLLPLTRMMMLIALSIMYIVYTQKLTVGLFIH